MRWQENNVNNINDETSKIFTHTSKRQRTQNEKLSRVNTPKKEREVSSLIFNREIKPLIIVTPVTVFEQSQVSSVLNKSFSGDHCILKFPFQYFERI